MFSHVGMSTPDTVPRSVPAPYARAPVSDCPQRRHCSFTLPAPGARADAHGASLPASSRHVSPCGRTQAAAALPPPPPSPSRARARARARACSPSRRGAVASERAVAPPTGRAQRRRDVGMRDGLREGGREGGRGGREGEGGGEWGAPPPAVRSRRPPAPETHYDPLMAAARPSDGSIHAINGAVPFTTHGRQLRTLMMHDEPNAI